MVAAGRLNNRRTRYPAIEGSPCLVYPDVRWLRRGVYAVDGERAPIWTEHFAT